MSGTLEAVGTIVNMLETGWKVIEANQPSADIHRGRANAVPQVDDWRGLTGTQGPNFYTWRLKYTNGFDMDVVDIQFKLNWEYAARYRSGGAYIPNLWLEVPHCSVLWGYDLSLDLVAQSPTNQGTEQAPIARIPVSVTGSISTPFWNENLEWSFILVGDGSSQN